MKPVSLTIKAGPGALKIIQSEGFDPELIGTIAGASGGAKWLVLSQLDRAILTHVVPRLKGPVHLLASSVGAWRFGCYAQDDPIAAIDRFEQAYLSQTYSDKPDIAEITETSRDILFQILGEGSVQQILQHPVFRTHIMAVRSRHVLASEHRWLLALGLLQAASLNAISRKSLGLFFERALFYDERDLPPFFHAQGFPIQKIPLSEDNLADAIIATGSIPLVLSGVRDIAGAKRGVYRDGGIIDYHHDLQHSAAGRITLYPHFYDHIIPGWFDKRLSWRRPRPEHVDRTVLISPSAEFVSKLPGAKIPDRRDFQNLSVEERLAAWTTCVQACQQMADEFAELILKEQLAACLQPL